MSRKDETVSKLVVGKEYFEEEINKRVLIGTEIQDRSIQTTRQLEQAKQEYYDWNDYNSEFLKHSFDNPNSEYKQKYDDVNMKLMYVMGNSQTEELREFKDDVKNKVNNLKQLNTKLSLIKVADGLPSKVETSEPSNNKKVFIVHGHNNEIKLEVARTLDKLGLIPIILHEQANAGNTIIEKFEEHSDVGYAVVILTDDDLGKAKNQEELNSRARQNVILELGFFIGTLSRKRVCPLYSKGVELPSDMSGVVYTELDKEGHWKIKLAKELKAADYEIDINKII